jgi:phage terminase small subunit
MSTALVIPQSNWANGLTAKQAAFVEAYVRARNATVAYDQAYDARGGAYTTRQLEGHRVLNDPRIQAAIKARQQIATEHAGASLGWILDRFVQIATADPRELIGLKIGCCRYCHGADFQYHWREREYLEALAEAEDAARNNPSLAVRYPDPGGGLDFNATKPPREDCPQCHGEGLERFVPRDTDNLSEQALLLYGGVKVKKDGYEIIIADRQKALELATRMVGGFSDNVRVSGAIAQMHVVADLAKLEPAEASKQYREFIAGSLT